MSAIVLEHSNDLLDYLTAFGTMGAALAAAAAAIVAYRQTRLMTSRDLQVSWVVIQWPGDEGGICEAKARVANRGLVAVTISSIFMGHAARRVPFLTSEIDVTSTFEGPHRLEPGESLGVTFSVSGSAEGMVVRAFSGAGDYFTSPPLVMSRSRRGLARLLHPRPLRGEWRT